MDREMMLEKFEREVQETMIDQGVEYGDAELIVAMKYGELHGDGDLLSIFPLTDEQRRLHRRSLLDVMAELGERDDETDAPDDPVSSAVASRGDRVAD